MHQKKPWNGRAVVALTAFAGLLIWSKLRLVTDFPRTVLADPEQAEVSPPTGDALRGGASRDPVEMDANSDAAGAYRTPSDE
jgi:hypothetical protein